MKVLMLVSSHAMALALGWVLFFELPTPPISAKPSPTRVEVEAKRVASPMPADPSSENAILRATSADFRALWKELHLRGEAEGRGGPGAITVFMDWCARDPEAALTALKDTFRPTYSHNYLNNAVGEQGVHLAEPLLKHWRELVYVKKLQHALNTAIKQVAMQDPQHGARLLVQLPGAMRELGGSGIFEKMNADQMRTFLTAYEAAGGLGSTRGGEGLPWAGVADRVNEIDPEHGLANWFPELQGEAAHAAFAQEMAERAIRFERWGEVIDLLGTLEGERREWTLASLTRNAGAAQRGRLLPLLEASARGGDWDLAEQVLATLEDRQMQDPPHVYLDWAFGADGPGRDPVAVRHAVALALRVNRDEALAWIAEIADPVQRRLAEAAVEEAEGGR